MCAMTTTQEAAIIRRCERCHCILSIYADEDAAMCWTCEAITEAAAPPPAPPTRVVKRRSRRLQRQVEQLLQETADRDDDLPPIADDDEDAKRWRAWRPARVIG
jgi:hypothetical protein